MWTSRNFCLFVSDAHRRLVKHGGFSFKLRDTSCELVCIAVAVIAGMPKMLVPEQCFGTRAHCKDWDSFVDDKLESRKIHALKLVGHGAQSMLWFAVLLSFNVRNFDIHCMSVDIHGRCLESQQGEMS